MDGILKADPTITVARAIEPGQHLQLHAIEATGLSDHIRFQGVEQPLQDRTHNGEQSCNFIGYCVSLALYNEFPWSAA